METARKHREREAERDRRQVAINWWLCAASTAIMTYLMVSASDTFRAFSPIPSNHVILYSASFVVCALQGWFSVNPVEGLVKIPVIVLLPPLIYGAGRTLLPSILFDGGRTPAAHIWSRQDTPTLNSLRRWTNSDGNACILGPAARDTARAGAGFSRVCRVRSGHAVCVIFHNLVLKNPDAWVPGHR